MLKARKIFAWGVNIALLASFVGVLGLWGLSYSYYQHITKGGWAGDGFIAMSLRGELVLQRWSDWDNDTGFYWRRGKLWPGGRKPYEYEQPGSRHFTFLRAGVWTGTEYVWPGHLYPNVQGAPLTDPRWTRHRYVAIVIPYWLAALVLGGILWHRWWMWRCQRRAERILLGMCARCGYDLLATPGRCPECGKGVGQPLVGGQEMVRGYRRPRLLKGELDHGKETLS